MDYKERYTPPVLHIEGAGVQGRVKGLVREFFNEVLHKNYTMPELVKVAEEKALRIGDPPGVRDELADPSFSYFGIFKIYDDKGEEFERFEVNSKEWKESYQGVLTARKLDS